MNTTDRDFEPIRDEEITSYRGQSGSQGSVFRQMKSGMAEKLNRAASTLHQKATTAQNTDISNFEHQAADWLHRSADYIDQMEPDRLRSDIENQVRRNPGKSLLIAGAAGLILGAILRRR